MSIELPMFSEPTEEQEIAALAARHGLSLEEAKKEYDIWLRIGPDVMTDMSPELLRRIDAEHERQKEMRKREQPENGAPE